MLHRLALILTAVLTLNVSVAEALRVCASQVKHEAHETKHDGCEKPETPPPAHAPTTCCDAMASCGPSVAIDGAADEGAVIPDRYSMTTGAARAPSALERAPEPPPPKG